MKGSGQKPRFMANFDEDFPNDISMIKGSTNLETTQFIEEISFNQDLLKKLQEIDPVTGNFVIDNKNSGGFEEDFYDNNDEEDDD